MGYRAEERQASFQSHIPSIGLHRYSSSHSRTDGLNRLAIGATSLIFTSYNAIFSLDFKFNKWPRMSNQRALILEMNVKNIRYP